MKHIIVLFSLCLSAITLGQNLMVNANFETGSLSPWNGFKNFVATDDLTNSMVGSIENGDGSLFQVFDVTPGNTYNVAFNYRWVNAGSTNMTVRVKDGISGGNNLVEFDLLQSVNIWHSANFSFTVPSTISTVRLIFYKDNGNRPFRLDNVVVFDENYNAPNFVDPNTPINAQPLGGEGDWVLDFSDEFNDTSLDQSKWYKSISTQSRAPRPELGITDWWWVEENAFLNGTGELVLRGTKVDANTMFCGSIESRDLYETVYGYMEARILIAETAKGNHTAFWLQSDGMSNVNNSGQDGAEIDIFESAWITDDTKAVIHFDGYGPDKKNHTIPYDTPSLHSGFHTFGMLWTENSIRIFYDGEEMSSTNPTKPFPFTQDPNGFPLVPQVPEWLWLSVGASFGDGDFISQPVGTLSDALVDYVRVYKPSSVLKIENSIKNSFKIYPNPANHSITIDTQHNKYNLNIYDVNGRILKQFKGNKSEKIDISNLNPGIYLFEITSKNQNSTKRIIKK